MGFTPKIIAHLNKKNFYILIGMNHMKLPNFELVSQPNPTNAKTIINKIQLYLNT